MKLFTSVLLCLFACCSFAQPKLANRTSLGISVETTYSLKAKITSVLPEYSGQVDVHSRGQLGFELNLHFRYALTEKLTINSSVFRGIYPTVLRYYLDQEFIGGLLSVTNGASSTAFFNYFGISGGMDKFFVIGDNVFSLQSIITAVFFPRTNYSEQVFSTRDGNINPDFLVFQQLLVSNEDRKMIIAPELSFKYYKKLNNRLQLYFFINGTFSSMRPIKGIFMVFGENQNIGGDLSKQYAHIGIGTGMYFLPSKKQH